MDKVLYIIGGVFVASMALSIVVGRMLRANRIMLEEDERLTLLRRP